MNLSLQTGNKISSDEHENEADSYRFLFSFPRKAHARWKPYSVMADKGDSQDLKSKAKEITKVSRNHHESLK